MTSNESNDLNLWKILIIDNNGTSLNSLANFIITQGYYVQYVPLSEISKQATPHNPPNVILIHDYLRETGFNNPKNKLGFQSLNIPIILIGVQNESNEKLKIIEEGYTDFITEPYSNKEILAKIKIHLAPKELEKKINEDYNRETLTLLRQSNESKRKIKKYQKFEKKIKHLNLTLDSIRSINQLIIKEKNLDKLIKKVCQILVKIYDYYNAWIILVDKNGNYLNSSEARIGGDFNKFIEQFKQKKEIFCWDHVKKNKDILTIKYPEEKCKDCSLTLKHKDWGILCASLRYEEKTLGLLTISLNREIFSNKEEIELFKDVVNDIAFAINNIYREQKQKEDQKKLQNTEEKFRDIVETTSNWIWELTIEGVYTYSSPKIEEILGYKPEEVVGKHPIDFMSEEEAKRTSEEFVDIIKSKNPFFNYEIVKRHKNGNEIIIESSGIPLFNDKNRLIGYRGVNRDITARKQIEKERISYMNFLKNLNQINTIIQKSSNIDKVLWDVLEMTLSIYNCDRAWLLYPCDKDLPYLKSIAEVTSKKYPGAFKKGVKIFKDSGPDEICEIVLNSKTPVSFGPDEKHKIQPHIIKEYSVLSQLAMAIYPRTGEPWIFGIQQCSHYRKWTTDEINLLNEIGRRIEDSLSLLLVFKNLQKSEKKYRALFENSPLGIYRTTPEGKVLMANPALLKMIGYDSLEELQKINIEKDLDKNIYPRSEYIKQITEKGTVSGFVTKYNKKDGTTIDISESAHAIKDDNNKIIYYEGWVQDITLRKKVEKALFESEQKFRNLFNSSSDGIVIINQDYNILAVNKTLLKLIGFQEKHLINNKILDFIAPQYINGTKNRIKMLYEGQALLPVEIEIYQKSGKTIPIELNSRIIDYENKKTILTILRDISFRKETERKILNTIIETEEKEKEKFAKDLHDGIGPLLSASKIYSKSIQLVKNDSERLKTIQKLEETINEAILSVQEISNNLSPHVLKNFGLVAAIETFYKKISDATSFKIAFGTNLEIRIPEKIEVTLYRIAVELINNTLKHSEADTVLLKILHENNNLIFDYADNGKGFNIDKTLSKNTGMGLSNMISRIKSLNGEIIMDSSKNNGFRVKIKIVL